MTNWNLSLFQFIHNFAGRSHALDVLGFLLADRLTYILALLALIFALLGKGWKQRIFLAGEMGIALILARGILTEAIRFFYIHPRPFAALGFQPLFPEDATNSFPSGHMTALFAIGTVIFYYNRRWGWSFMLLSFILGLGRIYAGVHWPADILAGIAIGILAAMAVHRFTRAYWRALQARQMSSENLPGA